jgi:hypothetical protein
MLFALLHYSRLCCVIMHTIALTELSTKIPVKVLIPVCLGNTHKKLLPAQLYRVCHKLCYLFERLYLANQAISVMPGGADMTRVPF